MQMSFPPWPSPCFKTIGKLKPNFSINSSSVSKSSFFKTFAGGTLRSIDLKNSLVFILSDAIATALTFEEITGILCFSSISSFIRATAIKGGSIPRSGTIAFTFSSIATSIGFSIPLGTI